MIQSLKKNSGLLLLIFSIVALIIYVFNQHRQISELRKVQRQYELITDKFEGLKTEYEHNLIQYKRIKSALDKSKLTLNSITKDLGTYSKYSKEHIQAIESELSSMLNAIDTTLIHSQPIVNLDSLFYP